MRKTILLIDDDKDVQESTSRVLEMHEYRVLLSGSLKETVEHLKRSTPDLVILDYLLSGESAEDIINFFRENKKTERIKIMIVSAHPNAQQIFIKTNVNGYLLKPFKIEELLEKINTLIALTSS